MRTKTARVILWIARIWSLLSILLVLAFAIGESVGSKGPSPSRQEWIGLTLWPIGAGLGLLIAWFRERLGGLVALGSLAAFYLWNLLRSGHLPRGPYFLLLTAPAFLFLIKFPLPHNERPRHA